MQRTALLLLFFVAAALSSAFAKSHSGHRAGHSGHRAGHPRTPRVHAVPGARAHRSSTARYRFQRAHPCPVNNKTTGPCPGYVIDHVQPLYRGGADTPGNMQWQTRVDAATKDRIE